MNKRIVATLATLGVLFVGGGAFALTGAGADTAKPEPNQEVFSYTAPTGPELTPVQAAEAGSYYARASAQEAGALQIEVAHGTDGQASAVNESRSPDEPATSNSPQIAAWRASTAYLVVIRGKQFAPSVPLKHGARQPTGTVLALILDAHTGQMEGLNLGPEAPNVAALGQVTALNIPENSTTAVAASVRAVPGWRGTLAGRVLVGGGPSRARRHPASYAKVLIQNAGHTLATATTNANGTFKVELLTGTYQVTARVGTCPPSKAVIKHRRTTSVNVSCSIR
jgi:hypothetical protein